MIVRCHLRFIKKREKELVRRSGTATNPSSSETAPLREPGCSNKEPVRKGAASSCPGDSFGRELLCMGSLTSCQRRSCCGGGGGVQPGNQQDKKEDSMLPTGPV